MTIRTTRAIVSFASPFRLKGFAAPAPAGDYEVETDEEAIEGNGRTVYVRVATLMFITSGGTTRTVTIDPADLDAALKRDATTPVP
jgi:hypothetical protein